MILAAFLLARLFPATEHRLVRLYRAPDHDLGGDLALRLAPLLPSPPVHWIHVEHHRSHLNSWLTAISFSFTEKLVFDLGLLAVLAVIDRLLPLNFYGVAGWYIGYLIINSFSHANFEFRPENYNRCLGKVLTTTTYHSLHHSRYTGNYGLGTRVLDRIFGTEWEDYERLYDRVSTEREPLKKLRERVRGVAAGSRSRCCGPASPNVSA